MDSETSVGTDVDGDCLNLNGAAPGVSRLKNCPKFISEATKTILREGCDVNDIFSYGVQGGDIEFRQQIAQFLSEEYGDHVDRENVVMTAGATHGLHVALTLLIAASSPVYVIDPSYFLGQALIQDNLPHDVIVPVPSDSDGPLIEEFERLIKAHQPGKDTSNGSKIYNNENDSTGKASIITASTSRKNKQRPYDGAAYLIPTYNNPRATSYSPDRCKALVTLARRYNLLLLADDIYNLFYFNTKEDQPRRLLTYDLPSDPDYGKGHVISNGSFSKILAPGLRLGWIEGPKEIAMMISNCMMSVSGGAFNQYVGKLLTELLRTGKIKEHLVDMREDYKNAMDAFCDVLDKGLPNECFFEKPEGGLFVWVRLHQNVNGTDFLKYCEKNHAVTFLPGIRTSPLKSYKNYIRLATSNEVKDTLVDAGKRICQAYKEFRALSSISHENSNREITYLDQTG